MKQLCFFMLLLSGLTFSCKSDEVSISSLPAAAKTYIDTNYPDYKIDEAENEHLCGGGSGYEVEIEKGEAEDGLNLTFDADGNFLFESTEIAMADLPASVANSIMTNYAGYSAEEPVRLNMADGSTRYEVNLEKGKSEKEVQFDPEGLVLCEIDGD